jgi:uncharacterized protein
MVGQAPIQEARTSMRLLFTRRSACCVLALCLARSASAAPAPIIDMHLHAFTADWFGPDPPSVCIDARYPAADPQSGYRNPAALESCDHPLEPARSDEELRTRTLALLEKHDMLAVASGPAQVVKAWQTAAPQWVIPALMVSGAKPLTPEIRAQFASGEFRVLGEIVAQYGGIAPASEALEPWFAMAEELDVPVALHMGPGPPGATYTGSPSYRTALGNPLELEPVLAKHPRLRIYIMHAGYPYLESLLAILYAYPQVYVDVGIIDYNTPRAAFHSYRKRIVRAGFGDRVMFGSDQMIWPEAIEAAIESIDTADFLSESEKRAIFYDNAARFLRLQRATTAAPGTGNGER